MKILIKTLALGAAVFLLVGCDQSVKTYKCKVPDGSGYYMIIVDAKENTVGFCGQKCNVRPVLRSAGELKEWTDTQAYVWQLDTGGMVLRRENLETTHSCASVRNGTR